MIEFDEENHIYKIDGRVKMSVTQKLRAAGILDDYSGIDPYYLERGTKVHEYCELYAQGWVTLDNIDDMVREDCVEFVRTFADIVFRLGLEYVSSEEPLYGGGAYCPECQEYDADIDEDGNCTVCWTTVTRLDYCGKYDLIMMWEGKRTLVELKTGTAPMWLGLQLAAYDKVLQVDELLGIELKTGKVYERADDFALNYVVWDDIINGTFDYQEWKSDRKRRRMRVLK